MDSNPDFKLKQARYDLMKTVEILFNKKTEDRISDKVPFSRLYDQAKDFIPIVLEDKNKVIFSVFSTNSFDDYVLGHSLNVCMLSALIGYLMGYEDENLTELTVAALLHDIGKRETPKEIIFKNGSLTDSEFAIIKKHPLDGVAFMERVYPGTSEMIKSGIRSHHERLDGSGYPLKTVDIPEVARIIAVADIFEAYVSMRAYHGKRTAMEGIACLKNTRGLDKDIVKTFTEDAVFFPSGSYVILSDRTIAVIENDCSGNCPDMISPDGKKIENGEILDMLTPVADTLQHRKEQV